MFSDDVFTCIRAAVLSIDLVHNKMMIDMLLVRGKEYLCTRDGVKDG